MMCVMPLSVRKDLEQAQRWFHALSDETRLQLLELLREGEQCVCDLTDALDAAQSRLSFHLKTLKDAGLVTDRRQGRWVYYSLNPAAFEALAQIVAGLHPRPGRGPARCCPEGPFFCPVISRTVDEQRTAGPRARPVPVHAQLGPQPDGRGVPAPPGRRAIRRGERRNGGARGEPTRRARDGGAGDRHLGAS